MPFIVAIDYDSTLFKGSYPEKGDPILKVIKKIKEFKSNGAEIVLWTCREGWTLQEAMERCKEQGIEFDAVNDNAPSQTKYMVEKLKEGSIFAHRKIFADIYVDDRSPGSIDYFLKIDVKSTCANFKDR